VAVVCATGFDVSHCPKFSLTGQNGVNLSEKWAEEPESYLSVATDGFPNYFMMMGPNCLGGHGSLVESLNWTGDYFVKIIKKMATEDIKYMVPKASAVDAFVKYGDEIHKRLVWTGSCSSVSVQLLLAVVNLAFQS
jgi:cation diffusion facilitator CzcD-associated flavoprotein CzcO